MSDLKRKNTYVDADIQGGLVRRIFLHWVVFFAITMMSVISIKALLGDPTMTLSQRISSEVRDFVVLGVIFLSLFPAFMLDSIRFSNRFVGPIVRLRRHLMELANQGMTKDVKFRTNDFWQSVANEFNRVNTLIREQQAELDRLKALLSKQESTSSV
jgi:signal transduction histidine kinase